MISFFTCNEDEQELTCKTVDEAVEEHLDWLVSCNEKLPKKVEVFKFSNVVVDEKEFYFVEDLMRKLNENYGDPDGEHSSLDAESTKILLLRENQIVNLLKEKYEPYECEKSGSEFIDTFDWIRNNEPSWLTDSKIIPLLPVHE